MLVAAGAAAWPTGDQECKGHSGAIDAKPKKTNTQRYMSTPLFEGIAEGSDPEP